MPFGGRAFEDNAPFLHLLIVPSNVIGLERARTAKLIKGARLARLEGAPHGLLWTHAEEVNRTLVEFIGQNKR